MEDFTTAELILYSTIKINSYKNTSVTSTGTGFFMHFPVNGSDHYAVIITNKHVIEAADSVSVACHLMQDGKPKGEFVNCTIAINDAIVTGHPDPDIDLCAINFSGIINEAMKDGTQLFYCPLSLDLIPEEDDWRYFDAIEDVTMIGCPNGMSDEVNNLPIIRKGITASALAKKYNGKDEFLVDMACFPGSSGSPIFIYNRFGYFDRKTKINYLDGSRLKLVGVLYAGPLVTNTGQIVLNRTPHIYVNSPMHLGFALRTTTILALRDAVIERYKQ